MSKTARAYMSIGEVVESLTEEFPDVSVSKVRFLESEGLIDPERTTSGYRKFYPSDMARLRYILRLQRDEFVPLRVIRQRLEHFDPAEVDLPVPDGAAQPSPPARSSEDEDDLIPTSGLSLTFEELAARVGLTPDELRELEDYGLIDSHPADGTVIYDEDDLLAAKIAKDFAKYGMEPRHLRMYKHFADREAGLFEQSVVPRSHGSAGNGKQLVSSLTELTKLSRRLKHLLLKAALRHHLND